MLMEGMFSFAPVSYTHLSHDIVIRPGDIVSIDTGAKIDGFNGDNACTYAVGKIDLEAQRLLDVTKAALYKGCVLYTSLPQVRQGRACGPRREGRQDGSRLQEVRR